MENSKLSRSQLSISGSSFDKTTCSRGGDSARICSAGKIGGEVGFRAARRI